MYILYKIGCKLKWFKIENVLLKSIEVFNLLIKLKVNLK